MRRIAAVLSAVTGLSGIWAVASQGSAGLVRDYKLDVRFVPDQGWMSGHATLSLDSLPGRASDPTFYLHGELRVDSVRAGGVEVPSRQRRVFYDYDYSLVANEVTCPTLPGTATRVEIWYSGHFHPSGARSPSDYMRIDADGVFLRSYGYSLWFPVFLPPRSDEVRADFSDVTIRTPAEFTSVFVGTRKGERVEGQERVTTWTASGISLFAAQCTAQRYQVVSDGNYFLYHYPDSLSAAAARAIMALASDLNREFGTHYRRQRTGGQFHLLEMPQYGDISSGNVTGATYWLWQGFTKDENAQRALAHELVHPYVDVSVARSDSLYALVVEGFPSYLHLPILARRLGDEFYNRFLGWMETLYLEKRTSGRDRRGSPVPPERPLLAITADELSTYKDEFVLSDRALLFMNWLYARMGEKSFFRFTSELLNQKALTTPGFRSIIGKYLPRSAGDVDLWVTTTEYPPRLHFEHFRRSGGR